MHRTWNACKAEVKEQRATSTSRGRNKRKKGTSGVMRDAQEGPEDSPLNP